MKPFARYLADYIHHLDIRAFAFTTFFLSVLIFLNYRFGIERSIQSIHNVAPRLIVFTAFYVCVLLFPYFLQLKRTKALSQKSNPDFYIVLLLAAFIFAVKIVHWNLLPITASIFTVHWDRYFSIVLELPLKLIFIAGALLLIQRKHSRGR